MAASRTDYNNGRGQGEGRVTALDRKIPLGSARRNFVASTQPSRQTPSAASGGTVSPAGSGPAPQWGASRTDRTGNGDRR